MARTLLECRHPHGELVLVEIEIGAPELEPIPDTALLLDDAGPLRRASWLAGRIALRRSAERAGVQLPPIGSDDRGAPRVPEGMSGSISHKRVSSGEGLGRIVAAGLFSSDRTHGTIGVDIDALEPARTRIAPKILRPAELERWSTRAPAEQWPALVATFSIKESIYKALDPHVRRYVAFSEAEVRLGSLPATSATRVDAWLDLARDEDGAFDVEAYVELRPSGGLVLSTARVRPRSV